MKRKTFFIWFIIIVILGIILSFVYFDDLFIEYVFVPPRPVQPDTSVSVKVTELKRMDFSDYIVCYGRIESRKSMNITAGTNGVIENIHYNTGDKVKKGELLLEIRNPGVKQIALNGIISYFKSIREQSYFERIREQRALEDITGKSSDDHSSAYEDLLNIIYDAAEDSDIKTKLMEFAGRTDIVYPSDQILYQEANLYNHIETLQSLRIYAPFDGIISDTYVFEGRRINSGELLFSFYSPSDLEIKANVPVNDFHKVKKGQSAVYTHIFGEGEYNKARVHSISKTLQEGRNSFVCSLDIIDGENLIPGMQIKVYIETDLIEDAIIIPNISIATARDRKYVFIVRDGHAMWTDIETGNSNFSYTHVKSGLNTGDRLVYEGHWTLTHQASINVIEEKDLSEFAFIR